MGDTEAWLPRQDPTAETRRVAVMDKHEDEQPTAAKRPLQLRTGCDTPIDPEDLVRVSGRDVTPARLEWAKRLIEEKGSAAAERYLP
jgi:hypothetical protein